MASSTTVIVVNWNGAEYLERLLMSLQVNRPDTIVVVDNASSDTSMEILSQNPNLHLIRNQKNLGFGAAANQGILLTQTPYLLLLNVDTEVLPNAIDKLERFLDENQTTAIVAPQLLNSDGTLQPSCRSFPSIHGLFLYLSYLDRVIPSNYRLSKEFHQTTREVDQPMGAGMMIRKQALNEVGLFDPHFFMYMEEVDLCYRIHQHGWKIFYLPEARMIHHGGGSTRKDWETSQTHFLRSVIRYYHKRTQGFRLMTLRVSLLIALFLRSIVLTFRGQLKRAWFFLKMSPRMLWID